jgi:hypothetical protein
LRECIGICFAASIAPKSEASVCNGLLQDWQSFVLKAFCLPKIRACCLPLFANV